MILGPAAGSLEACDSFVSPLLDLALDGAPITLAELVPVTVHAPADA